MARRGIRKREYENLDDSTIGRVVSLLEQEKPITKKAACEILNISYSTQRLGRILEEYKKRIEHTKRAMKANRGKPYSDLEIKELIADYLNGISITNIAASLYRSTASVKKKIKDLHLPERTTKSNYFRPELIPDEAVAEHFDVGELVWSARYNAVAEIRSQLPEDGNFSHIYSIWVFGKHNEFAYQPWWELGRLDVVKEFKIPAETFVNTEKSNFAYRIE